MSKRQFDDFDGFANGYRALHTENIRLSGADSFYFAENKVLTLKEYEANYELAMLDVGCGDGAVEIFIQQHFSNWRVDGIDISEKSLDQARQRNISNTKFGLYNGIQIPFEDNSFDIVFVAAVLHHIDFKLHQQFIEEIRRVLKKGGRVYIFEHNPLNPATRYLVNTCVFDKDARLLSHSYTQKLLSSFQSAQKKFILFFPRKGILSAFIKIEKKLSWLPLGAQYYFRAVK